MAQRTRFGIKGGTNFSVLTGADYKFKSAKFEPGYQFGVFAVRPSRMVHLQIEALYTSRDWTTTEEQNRVQSGTSILFSRELKNHNGYITVPFTAYIPLGRVLGVGLGAQIDKLVSSAAKGQQIITDIKTGNKTATALVWDYIQDKMGDPTGAYADYSASTPREGNFFNDLGLGGNLGLHFNLGRHLSAEGRLNYSFTDVVNQYYIQITNPNAPKTDQLISGQVLLGYRF